MKANRRWARQKQTAKIIKPISRRKVIASLIALVFLAMLAIVLVPRQGRRVVVAPQGNDVVVAVFDFDSDGITRINVPGETEVEVSRQYGKWKLGSVWKLAQSEKLDGSLLSSTIIKSMHFPANSWSNSTLTGLLERNLSGAILFLINGQNTGLSLLDRLQILIFNAQKGKASREEINLAETGYLVEKKLSDDSMGYVVSGSLPVRLAAIMSAPGIGNRVVRVGINNAAGDEYSFKVRSLVTTLEVVGTKVLSVKNINTNDTDCVVQGNAGDILVGYISDLLDCVVQEATGNFDIELTLGKKFMDRF